MSKKEYEAKPAQNPKPYQRKWAVWRGDWEIATCWTEPGAQYVADLMNGGRERAIQAEPKEETDDEALMRLYRDWFDLNSQRVQEYGKAVLKWERERVARASWPKPETQTKKNVDK